MPEEKPVEAYTAWDAGVRQQRRAIERAGAAPPRWTDVTCAADALQKDGLSLDDVRRHLYARDASDGRTAAPTRSPCSGRKRQAGAGSAG